MVCKLLVIKGFTVEYKNLSQTERKVGFQGVELARIIYGDQIAYLTAKGNVLFLIKDELNCSGYNVFDNLHAASDLRDKYGEPLFNRVLLSDIGIEIGKDYIEKLDL